MLESAVDGWMDGRMDGCVWVGGVVFYGIVWCGMDGR